MITCDYCEEDYDEEDILSDEDLDIHYCRYCITEYKKDRGMKLEEQDRNYEHAYAEYTRDGLNNMEI